MELVESRITLADLGANLLSIGRQTSAAVTFEMSEDRLTMRIGSFVVGTWRITKFYVADYGLHFPWSVFEDHRQNPRFFSTIEEALKYCRALLARLLH